jgi:hypothetical protein
MTDLSQPAVRGPAAPGALAARQPAGCRNWLIEAAYRMLQNNLDPEVAENPDALVVYGGIGKAARDWDCFEAILASLRQLGEDETCWSSRASRSACSAPTRTRRACCWPTPTWCPSGPPGSTSTSSTARA